MSMFESNNIDVITFHYLCKNPQLLPQINPKMFKVDSVKLLFKIVKAFIEKYGTVPSMDSVTQIRDVAAEDKEVQMFNPAKQPEDCINEFLGIAEGIMSHPMHQYSPEYIVKSSEAYLVHRKMETGADVTVTYLANSKPNADNIQEIVAKAQSMFLTQTTLILHEERAINFWSPEAHIQVQPEDLIPCSWPTLNKFLNGGFERKTLTHFWGAPNTGKTLFLATLARDMSMLGKNIFVASLEMDPKKYAKRMGSALFDLPMSEYAKHKELAFWRDKLAPKLVADEFGRVPGALYIQRFTHASPLTITMAADRLAKELGIKWDAVVYDYLGEMESSKNFTMQEMYALHKTNNGELFDHAVQFNWASITAHQVTPDSYDSEEMSLKSSAEGRGISHRTDNIFGIIQNPMMYTAHKFFLKSLKARDNEYKNYHMRMSIDARTMALTDDGFEVAPGKDLIL